MTGAFSAPTDSSLTAVERRLIEAFLPPHLGGPIPFLRAQLEACEAGPRESSGVGAFLDLVVPPDLPAAPLRRSLDLTGHLTVDGLRHGALAILFVHGGRLACLETASYAESWDGRSGIQVFRWNTPVEVPTRRGWFFRRRPTVRTPERPAPTAVLKALVDLAVDRSWQTRGKTFLQQVIEVLDAPKAAGLRPIDLLPALTASPRAARAWLQFSYDKRGRGGWAFEEQGSHFRVSRAPEPGRALTFERVEDAAAHFIWLESGRARGVQLPALHWAHYDGPWVLGLDPETPVDRFRHIEARVRTGLEPPTALIHAALDLHDAGVDGPRVQALAHADPDVEDDILWATEQVRPALGLPRLDERASRLLVARHVAGDVCRGAVAPTDGAVSLGHQVREADASGLYLYELGDFGDPARELQAHPARRGQRDAEILEACRDFLGV